MRGRCFESGTVSESDGRSERWRKEPTAIVDRVQSLAGNAVWQQVRRAQLTAAQARRVLGGIVGAPLEVYPTRELATLGLELALESGCTVYDGCYLGLAIFRECPLVSADARLEGLLPARYRRYFLPLASVPA